jgi:hypothetical protein
MNLPTAPSDRLQKGQRGQEVQGSVTRKVGTRRQRRPAMCEMHENVRPADEFVTVDRRAEVGLEPMHPILGIGKIRRHRPRDGGEVEILDRAEVFSQHAAEEAGGA